MGRENLGREIVTSESASLSPSWIALRPAEELGRPLGSGWS